MAEAREIGQAPVFRELLEWLAGMPAAGADSHPYAREIGSRFALLNLMASPEAFERRRPMPAGDRAGSRRI